MQLHEHPTNTAARGSNGPERSRWREAGVDPEDVADPFDVAEEARARKAAEALARAERQRVQMTEAAQRPLGALIAENVMRPAEHVPHPGTLAVQKSFGEL